MEIRQLHASPAATVRRQRRLWPARPSGAVPPGTRPARLSRLSRLVPPVTSPVASSAPSHATSGGS
jgi:hypothetical protein